MMRENTSQAASARHGLLRKLAGTSGETMVETIVSVLVSSIALLLLATAVGSAVNIVQASKQSMGEHYQSESRVARQSVLGTSSSVEGVDVEDRTITLSSPLTEDGSTQVNVIVYESQDGSALYERKGATP